MAALLLSLVSSQSVAMQLVVSTGDVLADGAEEYSYDWVGIPRINNHGQVAFFGGATTLGGSPLSGVWSQSTEGSLKSVATSLESAPDVAPHGYYITPNTVPPPILNDAGRTAFHGTLYGFGVLNPNNDQGIWSEGEEGELRLLFREGSPPPSSDLTTPLLFNLSGVELHFNSLGQTVYAGGVGGNPRAAIWKGTTPEDISLIASASYSLSGVEANRQFVLIGPPDLNDLGQVAFSATRGNRTGGSPGVWRTEADGQLLKVVEYLDVAPGLGGEVRFSNLFSGPDLNNHGEIVFVARTNEGPGSPVGIWSDAGNAGLQRVFHANMQVNGIGPGVTFSNFQNVMLGDGGHVVFTGTLQGTGMNPSNGSGIWKVEDGSSQLLAKLGEQAPGTPAGMVFAELGAPLVNAMGQVVFQARVVDSVDGGVGKSGIWAQDVDGETRLIALRGDLINISNDPTDPEYLQLGGIGFYDGRTSGLPRLSVSSSGFNDQGQIAFQGMVADLGSTRYRSAVLIANINGAVVPEPAGVVLVAMGIVTMMAARRWGR